MAIINKNLRWNLHVNNLITRLHSLTSNFYNLHYVIPIHILCIGYLAIYQTMFQYGLLVWGGLIENDLYPSIIQQKQFLHNICTFKEGYVRLLFK